MRSIEKSLIFAGVLVLALSFSACKGAETSSDVKSKETVKIKEPVASSKDDKKAVFTYSIIDETYTEKGITIKFPQLTKTSDVEKGDSINKAIQENIKTKLDSLRNENKDMGDLTLDLKYEAAGYSTSVFSISYQGYSHFKKAAYPINIYYTQNINIDEVDTLSLKDIFKIDNFFVEQFKLGLYSPTNPDVDLEKSGVDLKETIERQYTNTELLKLFQEDKVNYKLTEYGVIVSVEILHAMGDHLEMAIPYEAIENNMIKTSPVWKDYLFIKNEKITQTEKKEQISYIPYKNDRFGFSIEYPSTFVTKTDPDNDDGKIFSSKDNKSELTVSGINNALEQDVKSLYNELLKEHSNATYKKQEDNWFTVSWNEGDKIVYEKKVVGSEAIFTFLIKYPSSQKEIYDGIITHLNSSFKTPIVKDSTSNSSDIKPDVECKLYKSKIGYNILYPNVLTEITENIEEDAIYMKAADGLYTLKFWGRVGKQDSTGETLLAEAKKRVAHITDEYSDQRVYRLEYEGGGKDGKQISFYEYGFTMLGSPCAFVFSYPSEEKARFETAIWQMSDDLQKGNPVRVP